MDTGRPKYLGESNALPGVGVEVGLRTRGRHEDSRSGAGLTAARAVRAETSKLLSMRGALTTAITTVLLVVLGSWFLTTFLESQLESDGSVVTGGMHPDEALFAMLHIGQLGVIVLASLVHLQEDGRSVGVALLSVPRRGVLYTAKLVVVFLAVALVAIASVTGASVAHCLVTTCADEGAGETTGWPFALLSGVVVYWLVIGLLTFALSAAVNNAVVGVSVMVALVLGLSPLLAHQFDIARLLPDQVGARLYQTSVIGDGGTELFGILGVLCAWLVVVGLAGAWSYRRLHVTH